MKTHTFILLLFATLLFAGTVTATTFTGAAIVLDGGATTVNVSTCTWSFSEMSWDSGGDWLAVTGMTVTGSVTYSTPFTKNYTSLAGDYTCDTFPYGEMQTSDSTAPARYTMIAYTTILPLFAAMFLLAVMVPLILGLGQMMGWVGEVDWSLILKGVFFLCIGAILAGALTLGLAKLAGG